MIRKEIKNVPLKSSLSFARSFSTADVTCLGSISLKRGKWSLFNIGLSNSIASVVVIFKCEARVVDLDRTADRKDPERRPTDLTAKALVRIDILAKHNAMRENEGRLFINKKVSSVEFNFALPIVKQLVIQTMQK